MRICVYSLAPIIPSLACFSCISLCFYIYIMTAVTAVYQFLLISNFLFLVCSLSVNRVSVSKSGSILLLLWIMIEHI